VFADEIGRRGVGRPGPRFLASGLSLPLVSRPVSRTHIQSARQSVSQSVSQTDNLSVSESVRQSVSESVRQTVSQ